MNVFYCNATKTYTAMKMPKACYEVFENIIISNNHQVNTSISLIQKEVGG